MSGQYWAGLHGEETDQFLPKLTPMGAVENVHTRHKTFLLKFVEHLYRLSRLNRFPCRYTNSNRFRTVNHIRRRF